MMTLFPSALQLLPECFGAPINKPHTLTDQETDEFFYGRERRVSGQSRALRSGAPVRGGF